MPISRHRPLHALQRAAADLPRHQSLAELKGEVGPKAYDRQVRDANPWMRWYGLSIWRKLSAEHKRKNPKCKHCGEPMALVDHTKPHQGNWQLFIDPNNLQSLCNPCHGAKTATDGSRTFQRERR